MFYSKNRSLCVLRIKRQRSFQIVSVCTMDDLYLGRRFSSYEEILEWVVKLEKRECINTLLKPRNMEAGEFIFVDKS